MATTKDCVQFIYEETPRYEGAPTTTPYRLSTVTRYMPIQTVRLDPAPQHLDRSDEVRGFEGALPRLIDGYEPAGALTVRAYLNDLAFLLNSCGLTATIAAGDGVITDPDSAVIPTGASRIVFSKRGGITAKTMQAILCYVNEGVFLKGQGFGVSSLNLDANGQVNADLMGLVVANVADPNLSPSFDVGTIQHVRRGGLTLSWLASSGTTDDFSLSLSNPLNRRNALGVASYFPTKMEHGDERVYLTGSIPKSVLADADVDALIAASTFAASARWVSNSNIGASGYPYKLWVEMPSCQLVGGSFDDIANRRRRGGSFDWFAAWDESAGYDFKFTVVCALSALETYA